VMVWASARAPLQESTTVIRSIEKRKRLVPMDMTRNSAEEGAFHETPPL
jgi:hypothetical protein